MVIVLTKISLIPVATSEDSPVAMKLKKMWLKTPVGEEQAAQAVLDPALGKCPPCVRQSSQDKPRTLEAPSKIARFIS